MSRSSRIPGITALIPPRAPSDSKDRSRPGFDFQAQVVDVSIAQLLEQAVVQRMAGAGDDVGENDPIRPSRPECLERLR